MPTRWNLPSGHVYDGSEVQNTTLGTTQENKQNDSKTSEREKQKTTQEKQKSIRIAK